MKKIFTLIATALFALGANAQSTDVVELSGSTFDLENSTDNEWKFTGTDITIVPDGGRDKTKNPCNFPKTGETTFTALNVKKDSKQSIKLPTGVQLYRIQITGFSMGDNFDYIYAWGQEIGGIWDYVDPIGNGIKDNAVIVTAKYPIDPCGYVGSRTVPESTKDVGYIILDEDFGNEPFEGEFSYFVSGNNQAALNYKLYLSRAAADAATTGINTFKAVAENNSAAIYNVAGQQVSKNYKGLVIKNGKKIIQK